MFWHISDDLSGPVEMFDREAALCVFSCVLYQVSVVYRDNGRFEVARETQRAEVIDRIGNTLFCRFRVTPALSSKDKNDVHVWYSRWSYCRDR